MYRAVVERIWRVLDRWAPRQRGARHIATGSRGEAEAYFYLRKRGYTMVARNWRPSRGKGEVDLIGWDGEVLCFVEVKTRTSHAVKPAEAAVDRAKQDMLCVTARKYLTRMIPRPPYRFDVVSVYFAGDGGAVENIELFQNAFPPNR